MMLVTISVVAIVCILGLVSYQLLFHGYVRLNYPSFQTYPVQGIDISHHQHWIDWDTLLQEDGKYVQFVFVKATEGATHKDSRFQENWKAIKNKNLPRSAYHFFTFCTSGTDQAANFIAHVPLDSSDLPPAIDLEFSGNCQQSNRLPNYVEEIKNYISIIEKHYKKKVIIYSTKDFYDLHLRDSFLNNPIWIRDIYKEPKLENNRPWMFWQYANKGRLKGIGELVDINVFRGSRAELDSLMTDTICQGF